LAKSLGKKVTIKSAQDQNTPPTPNDPVQAAALSNFIVNSMVDFNLFSSRFLKIQTKIGELKDFEINEVQALIEQIITEIREKKRLVRLVILKSRRKGISTWVSGRFFWKTITKKNHYSMIVTHEPEATDFIFKMHKRFLDHLPEILKPSERYNNKRMLEFNDQNGTGLDSSVKVGTAGKEDFGSGQLIHDLHLSELAKYPSYTCTPLLLSLFQCVPEHPDTEIIIESTAKGIGGEFYDRYWSSRYRYEFYLDPEGNPTYRETINEDSSEDNEFSSLFIPWFVFKEYQQEPKGTLTYTDEELELIKNHHVTDRQLAWRRWCIVNKCNEDVSLFNQEYPATAMEAFISSSDNIFDIRLLQEKIKVAPAPKAIYSVNTVTGILVADPKGKLKVWDEPKPSRQYMVSGDPAEGIVGKDFSSLDVVDVLTGKQVAHYHATVPPDLFGFISLQIARRYNNAQIVIERNNHGLTVIDKIIDLGYTNLYAEMVIEPPARPRKRYGWLTSKVSKPRIIDNLIAEFRENLDGIVCKETLEEMLFFKQHEDMTLGAEEGHKDDRVISIAIAKYVITKLPVTKNRVRIALNAANSYTTQRKQQGVSSASWT
jgi:hypothetical protein